MQVSGSGFGKGSQEGLILTLFVHHIPRTAEREAAGRTGIDGWMDEWREEGEMEGGTEEEREASRIGRVGL